MHWHNNSASTSVLFPNTIIRNKQRRSLCDLILSHQAPSGESLCHLLVKMFGALNLVLARRSLVPRRPFSSSNKKTPSPSSSAAKREAEKRFDQSTVTSGKKSKHTDPNTLTPEEKAKARPLCPLSLTPVGLSSSLNNILLNI